MAKSKTSRRGIKNYTTEISVEKTIGEIEILLAKYGARKILKEYDDNQQITYLSFMVKHETSYIPIRLPSNPEKIIVILNEKAESREIPKKYLNDMGQARRIMWRVILDWIDSQMTMIEIGQRSLLEIFFADVCPIGSDETLYKNLTKKGLPEYLIEDKREET